METATETAEKQWPMWVDVLLSIFRTLIGLIFIFWLLTIVPITPDPSALLPISLLVGGSVVYVLVLRVQLKRVYRARRPGFLAIESLILSAALFVAIFSAIYVIIEGASPGSFSEPINHFTASYFALTVLATVGFGDITAVSDIARAVVMVQMALGLVFIAVIVKVFTSAAQRARAERDAQARRALDEGVDS